MRRNGPQSVEAQVSAQVKAAFSRGLPIRYARNARRTDGRPVGPNPNPTPITILDLPDEVLGAVLAHLGPAACPAVQETWTSPSPIWSRLLRTHAAAFGPLSQVQAPSRASDQVKAAQIDLARAARVCRRFHRIAIPLLYQSPIVAPRSATGPKWDGVYRRFAAALGNARDARLGNLVCGRDHVEFVHFPASLTALDAAKLLQNVLLDAPRLRVDLFRIGDSPEELPAEKDQIIRVAVLIDNTGRSVVTGPRALRGNPLKALERAAYVAIGGNPLALHSNSPAPEMPSPTSSAANLNLLELPDRLTNLEQLYVGGDPSRLGVTLGALLASAPLLGLAVFAQMPLEQWQTAWPFPWHETPSVLPENIAQVSARVPTLKTLAANLVPRMDWLLLFPNLCHLDLRVPSVHNLPPDSVHSADAGTREAAGAKDVLDFEGWICAMIPPEERVALAAVLQLRTECEFTVRVPLQAAIGHTGNLLSPLAIFGTHLGGGAPQGDAAADGDDLGSPLGSPLGSARQNSLGAVESDDEFGCHTASSLLAALCHPRCRPRLETLYCEGTVLGQFDLFELLENQPRLVELHAGLALLKEPPTYQPLRPALNLTTLSLFDCPIRTDATLSLLARSCTALQTLAILVCFSDQSGDGLEAVARLPRLRNFYLQIVLVERALPSFKASESQLARCWRALLPAAPLLQECTIRVCAQYAVIPELAIALWPVREMRAFVFSCTQAHLRLDVAIRVCDPSPDFDDNIFYSGSGPHRLPLQFRDSDEPFVEPQTDDTFALVLHSLFSARHLLETQRGVQKWLKRNVRVSPDGVSVSVRHGASSGDYHLGVLCGILIGKTNIQRHPVSLTLVNSSPLVTSMGYLHSEHRWLRLECRAPLPFSALPSL